MIRVKLKEVLQERGISMTKFGHMANLDAVTVRAIYHDRKRSITLATLERIALALDMPPGDLLEMVPDETQPSARE